MSEAPTAIAPPSMISKIVETPDLIKSRVGNEMKVYFISSLLKLAQCPGSFFIIRRNDGDIQNIFTGFFKETDAVRPSILFGDKRNSVIAYRNRGKIKIGNAIF